MSAAVGEDQLTTEEERAGGSIGPGRVRASRQAGSSGGGRGGEITRGGRFVFIWGARDGIEARSVQFGWRARTVFLKFEFVVGKEAEVFGARTCARFVCAFHPSRKRRRRPVARSISIYVGYGVL